MDNIKKKILLVEDEILIAMHEKVELEKIGYLVVHAINGEEAVKKAVEGDVSFDVILMDIDLGAGIDGTQAAEIILETIDIPVVFLSSHTERDVVEKTEKITSYGYAVKNSGFIVLDASIKMAIRLFHEKMERKQAEDKATLSEENYRFQFMNMNSYNSLYEILTDENGRPYDFRFLMVNRAYEDYVGKTSSELVGRTLLEVYPQTEQYWIDKMAEAVVAGIPVHFESYSQEMNTFTEVNLYMPKAGQLAMTTANISERKQAEEKFRVLYQSMMDAYVSVNMDGTIIECNQAYLNLLGYTKEEIGTLTYKDITPEKWHAYESEIVASQVMPHGYSEIYEKEYIRKDGTVLPIELRTVLMKNSKGEPVSMWAIVRDITARKTNENRLLQRERELNKAQEIAHVGTWYLDVATNNVHWLEELYKMYGFDPALPVPPYTEHMKLFTAESWELLSTSMAKTRDTGVAYELELKTMKKDGTNGWMWVRGEAVHDNHGKLVGLWGAAQDISERKKSEEELQQTTNLLTAVVEQSPVPMVIVTARDEMIKYFNEASLRYHDIDESEIRNHRLSEIDWSWVNRTADGEVIPPDETAIAKALRGETTHAQVIQTTTRNGNVRWNETMASPVYDNAGNIIAAFVIFPDITDRRIAEQEIQKQLTEKEVLLREVHHRLKNNMANIESLLSLQAGASESSVVKAALKDSISRVQSMRILYDKLLLDNDYETVSIKAYVEGLVDSIAEAYNIQSRTSIEKHIADFRIVSRTAISLGIIINELFTNICKYAFPDQKNGHVAISIEKKENMATLVIQDNGVGLDLSAASGKSPGSGLSIVALLAQQLNGTFNYSNEHGAKSVVVFDVTVFR